jgi:hypothetical protein
MSLSPAEIQTALAILSDPNVNSQIYYASSVTVAKNIIRSLPGVEELRADGPAVINAVLTLLQQQQSVENENILAIGLHILEAYPTDDVKLVLARRIADRRFTGLSGFLAAETFLRAVGIDVVRKDITTTALREARKIVGAQIKATRPPIAKPSQKRALTGERKRRLRRLPAKSPKR